VKIYEFSTPSLQNLSPFFTQIPLAFFILFSNLRKTSSGVLFSLKGTNTPRGALCNPKEQHREPQRGKKENHGEKNF